MICLSCGVEAAAVFGVRGETGSAVTFIQFIQSLYIQSKLTYTHSCTRTQTQKTTHLNSVNCILNNTLRTHTLCYMQMHSFKNTKNYTHTHEQREGQRKDKWKRNYESVLYSSLRLVLYFESIISCSLSYTNIHSFSVCDTHTDGSQRVSARASVRRKYTSVITL